MQNLNEMKGACVHFFTQAKKFSISWWNRPSFLRSTVPNWKVEKWRFFDHTPVLRVQEDAKATHFDAFSERSNVDEWCGLGRRAYEVVEPGVILTS